MGVMYFFLFGLQNGSEHRRTNNLELPPLVDAGLQQTRSIQALEVDLLGILLGCLLLARLLALLAAGRIQIGLDKVKHDEHLVR